MRVIALSVLVCLFGVVSCTQPDNKVTIGEFKNISSTERTIQVTGSADMSVVPDEVEFIIEIEEYYEEQFQDNKSEKDYKTKVQIEQIENELMNKLFFLGITPTQITIENVGSYWYYRYKMANISKRFSLRLTNLKDIDRIISAVDMKGISYMRIGELTNFKIQDYRKEVKKEAVKAAKEKAKYLLSSLEKELGEVITVKEIENFNSWGGYYFGASYANSTLSSNQGAQGAELRQIDLKYSIEVTFAIK